MKDGGLQKRRKGKWRCKVNIEIQIIREENSTKGKESEKK